MRSLVEKVMRGDRRTLARLITQIENDPAEVAEILATLYPATGRAQIIGITGASGTGKSSLVNKITLTLRQQGLTVAIIAVDPTSPLYGRRRAGRSRQDA